MPNRFPLEEGTLLDASMLSVAGTLGLLQCPQGCLGIWGLDARGPVFHLELEPLSRTTDSRAWKWKNGQKLGQAGIRHRPQSNLTLFFLLSESLVQPNPQNCHKNSSFFSSGLVRTQTLTFKKGLGRALVDLCMKPETPEKCQRLGMPENGARVVDVSFLALVLSCLRVPSQQLLIAKWAQLQLT